ncbi:TnpV protein [[Clostridium] colinum]|uniref:TnpV protein n=1 Tax=[Clostridium] colinum TaxID=36835 RepID=UPI0020254D70|nr:TnpV protein [[Clostridium] colinum]
MEKYKIENGIKYELGKHGMYYPIFEEEEFKVGKYGKMAMEHMKTINKARYSFLGVAGKLPKIFNDIDEKVYNIIDNIMEKKLEKEPIQDDWNIVEIERHKKMLYREAEEIALQEVVYQDHFLNVDIEKVLE